MDFEQPRALYEKVLDEVGRQHLVNNIVEHVRGVKNAELKLRVRTCSLFFGDVACVCLIVLH